MLLTRSWDQLTFTCMENVRDWMQTQCFRDFHQLLFASSHYYCPQWRVLLHYQERQCIDPCREWDMNPEWVLHCTWHSSQWKDWSFFFCTATIGNAHSKCARLLVSISNILLISRFLNSLAQGHDQHGRKGSIAHFTKLMQFDVSPPGIGLNVRLKHFQWLTTLMGIWCNKQNSRLTLVPHFTKPFVKGYVLWRV